MLLRPLSGGSTWRYTVQMDMTTPTANYAHAGLVLRDSGTGTLRLFAMRYDGGFKFQRMHYADHANFYALDSGISSPVPSSYGWQRTWTFRLTNNGTNIKGEVSPDGGVT